MGALFNSTVDILRESSIINKDDCFSENPELQFNKVINELPTADGYFKYAPEMIPVISLKSITESKDEYLVEYDNLYKLMESMGCDEVEALNAICECNGISADDTSILIESKKSIKDKVGGAPVNAKKKVMKSIKKLKNKGLKVKCKKDESCSSEGCNSEGCKGGEKPASGKKESCGESYFI